MQRIVVGVDGSVASNAALMWAGRLAETTGAELTAAHAHRRPYAEIPPEEHERMLAERSEILATRWVRPAEDLGIAVRTRVIEGDPRRSLMAFLDEEQPDLLVLGRSGAGGGPGFLHLGSVVEHVAHHVNRPLAVVPTGAHTAIGRIVLGVDGSAESAGAVRWCADVAAAVGAAVIAVTVHEPVAEWTPAWDDLNWRRDAERNVEQWVEPLTAVGITAEVVASEHLHPADGLLGVASARGADLLVIGTRGAGGFTGLRSGGVAMKILHRASLPLVLVPPTDAS